MDIPSLEELRHNRERTKRLRKQAVEDVTKCNSAPQTTLHPLAAAVIDVVQEMKTEGKKAVDLRDTVRALRDSGITVPFKELCSTVSRILADCGFEIAEKFPTVFKMPYVLPVIENGVVTTGIILDTPVPAPEPTNPEFEQLMEELGDSGPQELAPGTVITEPADGFYPQRGRDY